MLELIIWMYLLDMSMVLFCAVINCLTSNLSALSSIIVNDFNNNGRVGVVVANCGTDNIAVYFGNNNGTSFNQATMVDFCTF